MRLIDIIVIMAFAIGIMLAFTAHHNAKQACLTAKKPQTTATSPRFVEPFTGAYKHERGVLYCYDSRGNRYAVG